MKRTTHSMNRSGKTITIFLILFVVLLVCSTSISLFFFLKESESRKNLEVQLLETQKSEMKLQADVKEFSKQLTIAQEKNKEWEEKYNNILDELELEESLREEMKTENTALKEALASEAKNREKVRQDLTQELEQTTLKIKTIQEQLEASQKQNLELQTQLSDMEKKTSNTSLGASSLSGTAEPSDDPAAVTPKDVELTKIVVNPDSNIKGRVLSVDKDSEFIIIDLGIKDGLQKEDVLSVYRGNDYLGDVQVSRLQDEISAADLIPPFSTRAVRKNDAVLPKNFD